MTIRCSSLSPLLLLALAACSGRADARDAPPPKLAPALEPTELVGEWQLIALPNGPALVPDQTPYIEFFENRIRGHTGCNTVAGPLASDSVSMRLGRLAVSKVGCPSPEAVTVERALLGALQAARIFGMHGRQLVVAGQGRVELARFEMGGSR